MVVKTIMAILLFCGCHRAWAQDKTPITDTAMREAGYKRATVFISPALFTENGPGAGIAYDCPVNARKNIAVHISAIATFNIANTNKIYNYNTGYYNTGNPDAMFYLMPGVQFYPFGSKSKFGYSLGPSLVIAGGKKSSPYYNYNGLNEAELVQKHFVTGITLQNCIRYRYTSRICLELEAGCGGSLINKTGGVNEDSQLLVNGALQIGFRL